MSVSYCILGKLECRIFDFLQTKISLKITKLSLPCISGLKLSNVRNHVQMISYWGKFEIMSGNSQGNVG